MPPNILRTGIFIVNWLRRRYTVCFSAITRNAGIKFRYIYKTSTNMNIPLRYTECLSKVHFYVFYYTEKSDTFASGFERLFSFFKILIFF